MQGGRRAFGATCSLPPTQRLLLQVDREGGRAEEKEEVAGLATVLRDGLFGPTLKTYPDSGVCQDFYVVIKPRNAEPFVCFGHV